MAPPGTPPEAQSAPADSQSTLAPPRLSPVHDPFPCAATSPPCAVWEAHKGEVAQSAPLAKLKRVELVQKEEARLKAEVSLLRTQVRQARAHTLDFVEQARHARGKLAQEKEKLAELEKKVMLDRTTVAAWPGGDRGLVDDPEVAALATKVTVEQEWLAHVRATPSVLHTSAPASAPAAAPMRPPQARTTLRDVVEKRDLELRRLGPAALLDGADVETKASTAKSYSRRLAKPTKQLGKKEMKNVAKANFRGLDGQWCRGLVPEPGSDKIMRPDEIERVS